MTSILLSLLFLFGCVFQNVKPISNEIQARSRAGNVTPSPDYEAALSSLLSRVVTDDGLVRYDLLRGDFNDDFRHVLKAVEDFDANRLHSQEDRLAFWINAYNVQMLQNIIETPEVQNIVADGFADRFFRSPYRTAGLDITLDQIENVILRGQETDGNLAVFRLARLDPRLHAGINCAAISCPRLRRTAFTRGNINIELDAAMKDFTDAPRHMRRDGDGFVLSSILDWFGSDFDTQGESAGDYLLQFMSNTRPDFAQLKILFEGRTAEQIKALPRVRFEYVWLINAAPIPQQ